MMRDNAETTDPLKDLKCPECRFALKPRRARVVDKCELVCGGCGQIFDVCDLDTLTRLQKQTP
jgi:hypothetical protein